MDTNELEKRLTGLTEYAMTLEENMRILMRAVELIEHNGCVNDARIARQALWDYFDAKGKV